MKFKIQIFFIHVELCGSTRQDELLRRSSCFTAQSSFTYCVIRLTLMHLYPMDCLSIGYFVRHAICSGGTPNEWIIILDLSSCQLGTVEIEALTQEMSKPAAPKGGVTLNLVGNCVSADAAFSLNELFHCHSCLNGIYIDASLITDTTATRTLIGGLFKSQCTSIALYYCSTGIFYYLILLLRHPCLQTFDIAFSSDLFAATRISEALK